MMRPYVTPAPAIGGLAAIALHAPCLAHVPAAALHAWRAAAQGLPTAAAAYAGSALVTPPALPPGGSCHTPLGEGMRLQGQPVFAWVFDAPGSLRDLASWLTGPRSRRCGTCGWGRARSCSPASRKAWHVGRSIVRCRRGPDAGHDFGHGRGRGCHLRTPRQSLPAVGLAGGATEPAGARTAPLATEGGRRIRDGGCRAAIRDFEFRSRDEAASIVEQSGRMPFPVRLVHKQLAGEFLAAGWRPADVGAAGLGSIMADGTDHAAGSAGLVARAHDAVRDHRSGEDQGSGVTAIMRIGAQQACSTGFRSAG